MFKRLVPALAVAAVAVPAALAGPAQAAPADGLSFHVLGEVGIPGLTVNGATFGGLSGVDFDAASNTWRAISDDRSDHGPARFYSLSLGVTQSAMTASVQSGMVPLLRKDGTPYPPSATAGPDTVQPQAIRYDPTTKNVFWAEAGENTSTLTVDPSLREASATGQFVAQLPASNRLKSTVTGGIQPGKGLSGLTFSTNNALAVSTVAAPLLQDGTGVTRITGQSRALNWNIVWQYTYQLDALTGDQVVDILAVDTTHYLVLERADNNNVRLYEIDVTGATNVAGVSALAGATFTPVSKKLVLDFASLGLCEPAAFSGLTWGPVLPNGQRTLVFVSDNGFDRRINTEILALAVSGS
ncbi:esterase-like activity of phytase family protein [Kutzneria sp. CA-103260]|uniref:esterase-like activity of phytase family protein n=1 Tax=Kutzneria sp. CA-103260 TaxID=2802641 RepID=UPI001BA6FF36|nr:esterase-like activity of phytase family protein [Kutzneria sp. CA-103260]QUQ63563.1 phytase [Kutzneria sp. CA-103260]